MKNTLILFFTFISTYALSAQQGEPATISQEDYRKIVHYLQSNYNIPIQVYADSVDQIRYHIRFQIDEEGYALEPQITAKTTECQPCERELTRVIKSMPRVNPIIQDGRAIKAIFTLPFVINLQ